MNLYLYLYILKVQFNKATSKTWTQALKNMDPGKHGIYMGCLTLESYVLTKSMFLLIKYSVPPILIE